MVERSKFPEVDVYEHELELDTSRVISGEFPTARIADLAIITAKLAALAVTTAKLADLAVATGKIADLAVATGKVADLAIATAKIADLGVTTAKLADLGTTTAKIADLAVTNAKVADATLVTGKLVADTIALTVDIPILATGTAVTVAADAIAAVTFPHTTVLLDTATIKHLKSAALILDHAWAATADGYIELYDVTGLAVRATTALLVGAEASVWLAIAATGLVAGNTMVVRANVTVAGAAGETASLFRAILRLTLGIS